MSFEPRLEFWQIVLNNVGIEIHVDETVARSAWAQRFVPTVNSYEVRDIYGSAYIINPKDIITITNQNPAIREGIYLQEKALAAEAKERRVEHRQPWEDDD